MKALDITYEHMIHDHMYHAARMQLTLIPCDNGHLREAVWCTCDHRTRQIAEDHLATLGCPSCKEET